MREMRANGWDAILPPHETHEHPDRDQFAKSTTIWNFDGVEADIWVLQRVHCMGLRGSRGKLVIAENDDDSLHLPKWHRNYRRATKLIDSMHEGFRHADALTVSTPALAEAYKHLNPNVHVLRNYLDWEMWADVPLQYEQDRPRVRVGWMGSYDFRVGDLHVLRGVIGPWLHQHPEVDFVVAGHNADKTHDLLGVPHQQRISYDPVEFRSGRLPDITAVMDIGLVPLEPGLFNEAKSHLKGMEYAACGIPCIAYPTESYRYWVEEGVNGLYAKKPGQWREALEAFVGDDDFRRDCGRQARQKAADQTIQKHWGEWAALYMALGAGRVPDAVAS
jgi:glycosyltransferase involved in cell wall biosynthesis